MQQAIRWCLVLAGGALALACRSEPEEAMPPDTLAAAVTISLADVAGVWSMRYVPVSGDTTVTTGQVQIEDDRWTLVVAGRDPIEGEVTLSGDSILVEEGPYESIRRDGVTVTMNSVYRLEGERLVGTAVARYAGVGADSVLVMRSEGTRAP